MANILQYTKEMEKTFAQRPPHGVDGLVLSQLIYLEYDGLVPGQDSGAPPVALADFASMLDKDSLYDRVLSAKPSRQLLEAAVKSPRFSSLRLCRYAERLDLAAEQQFAAITYLLPTGGAFVVFRGTDSSFVGWKEDFNMAFQPHVPAQEAGAKYLLETAAALGGPLWIGGHSKGGNVAIYAASQCGEPLCGRIQRVYSFDGPGFSQEVLDRPGFARITPLVHKYVPESSVVGMMLQGQEPYKIVKSGRLGIFQHDPFSWQVEEEEFSYAEALDSGSVAFQDTVHKWLESLPTEDRARFVDGLFATVTAAGYENFFDIPKDIGAFVRALGEVDPETRAFVHKTLQGLWDLGAAKMSAEVRAAWEAAVQQRIAIPVQQLREAVDETLEQRIAAPAREWKTAVDHEVEQRIVLPTQQLRAAVGSGVEQFIMLPAQQLKEAVEEMRERILPGSENTAEKEIGLKDEMEKHPVETDGRPSAFDANQGQRQGGTQL